MFLEKCKEMVQKNISKPLDEKSLEIMQYVVAALTLRLGKVATDRLPSILKELNIYAENKSIVEMAHEYLQNYQEDNELANCGACVTRSISVDENGSFLGEKRFLLLSLSNDDDSYEIVSKLVHEFIHLLRFGGAQQNGTQIKIKDGISVSYLDTQNRKMRRKHETLEEGIVQKCTNEALHTLFELLKEEKIQTPISEEFQRGYNSSEFLDYYLERTLIEALCINPTFNDLVEKSFTEDTTPSTSIKYFNSVMRSPSAFIELEKSLERIRDNNSNTSVINQELSNAKKMVTQFRNATQQKKKN